MLNQYLKKVSDKIVHTGEVLEFYIPMGFFDTNIAVFTGNTLRTIGLFYARGFKANKPIFTELVNLPSDLNVYPASIREEHVKITGFEDDDRYKVLSFYRNSPVMDAFIVQDSDNIQKFLDLVLAGKIDFVPYSQLLNVWIKNLNINKVGLKVPASSQEIVLSEMYASITNPDITYGVAKNKNPKLGDLEYKSRNIREICSRSSTFAGLTFEDFDTMMASSLNMSKEEKTQQVSPLEKVIKY